MTAVSTPVGDGERWTDADLIARSAAIESTGWDEAIDLLSRQNQIDRSDDLETELAALRARSADRHARSAGDPRPSVAPGKAPPVGPSGLPEATLEELSAAVLGAAIAANGALLVRGALDADRIAGLVRSIDRAFSARAAATGDRAGDAERSSWWHPLKVGPGAQAGLARSWIRAGGGLLLADSPRMVSELFTLYESMGLRDLAIEFLGVRPVISANKCTLRRVPLEATGGWHQDGAFLGSQVRALNFWLTLTPCGVDAPGLDVVPRRFETTLETGTRGSYFDWAVGDDAVAEIAGAGGVVRPRFDAGDLLIFDELFLHRTAVDEHMTSERHAIETWCFAPSAYPDGHVPLVW